MNSLRSPSASFSFLVVLSLVATGGVDARCSTDYDCTRGWGECQSGKCECAPGRFESDGSQSRLSDDATCAASSFTVDWDFAQSYLAALIIASSIQWSIATSGIIQLARLYAASGGWRKAFKLNLQFVCLTSLWVAACFRVIFYVCYKLMYPSIFEWSNIQLNNALSFLPDYLEGNVASMVIFFLHELCGKQIRSDGTIRKVMTGIGFVILTCVFIVGVIVPVRVALLAWLFVETGLLFIWSISNLYFGLIKARGLIYKSKITPPAQGAFGTGMTPVTAKPRSAPAGPNVQAAPDKPRVGSLVAAPPSPLHLSSPQPPQPPQSQPLARTDSTKTSMAITIDAAPKSSNSPKPSTELQLPTPSPGGAGGTDVRPLIPPSPNGTATPHAAAAGSLVPSTPGRASLAATTPTASTNNSGALDRSVRNIVRGCTACGALGLLAVLLLGFLTSTAGYVTQLTLFTALRWVSLLWNATMIWIFFPIIKPSGIAASATRYGAPSRR